MICPYKIKKRLIELGLSEDDARIRAWSFWAKVRKHTIKTTNIDYNKMSSDLLSKGFISTVAKHISAEIAAKIILQPYKDFSDCVHSQMSRHNMTKANAVKKCKALAAKKVHGGIPSKKKKEGCGCNG